MKKLIPPALLSIFLTCLAVTAKGSPGCVDHGDTTTIGTVKERREAFNKAIADKDIDGVAGVLAEDVILVTGSDSDLYSGANTQIELWSKEFENPDRAIYVRTPACIRVSPILPIALEYGSWRGERIVTKDDFAAGSYAAKWRKSGDQWLLESEIFATEDCGGSFCPASE